MKQHLRNKIAIAVLLSLSSFELYAQHHWAIAVLENGKEKPTIMEYHSVTEKAKNGIEYHRIFDDGLTAARLKVSFDMPLTSSRVKTLVGRLLR